MVINNTNIKNNINIDLSIKIGKLKLQNPIIAASGTFGYADEYEDYINLKNIGAIITKGISLKPRKGNPQPRLQEVQSGLINCIGLENIGIDSFIKNKIPILINKNIKYIVNIAGFTIDEYFELASICESNNIQAIEVNVSCPNVKTGCLEFGTDQEILYTIISKIREVYNHTLIVKLTPNVTNPIPLALKIQQAGADAISAINTVKGMAIKTQFKDNKLTFSKIKGGLSGPAIKPIALNYINTIKEYINIPIIGMGGIYNINDTLEFFAAGSQAIQIGTANFTYPDITEKITNDLKKILIQNNQKSFEGFIKGVNNANIN
ncbi:MAG: dihydroorotate dehydrogenase [Vampirovibrionia bacterium]